MRRRQVYKLVHETKTKVLNITAGLVLVATSIGGGLPLILSKTVFASGVAISNSTDLRNAIEHQADGQTWTIKPGDYAVTPNTTITEGGQTGWYLPITANNITINGVGNPTIYGDSYSANGVWATQDLVAIFGNNVTINGLTLMPKVEPNKTIEVLGDNATIENTTVEPNTKTSPAEFSNPFDHTEDHWGGSIYYNNAGGAQTLINVTVNNGGISDHAPGATLNLTNVHLNYATNVDWINGYRFATHGNPVTGAPLITYHVDSTLNNLDDVLANLQNGDTISLDSNLKTPKQLTLTKSVTFNGNGNTISPNFTKTNNDNNSALGIQADNVTVNNLIEDGTSGGSLHGINVFDTTGVNLNDVTVENNDHSGLNVNGSAVTVNNLTTANNGWNGADVDKTNAVLTVNGTSHHTGELADIYVDDASVGQVIDTTNQYSVTHPVIHANDSAYNLKPAVPTLTYPANNSFINTNNFWFDWNDAPGAVSYEFQASQSSSTDGNHSLNSGVWSGDYQHNQPTASTLHSVGASGTWYWQVRAVNAKGTKSDWSAVWKMTIDMTKPSTPTITAPTAGQYFNSTPIVDSWTAATDSLSGVDHYQIAYLYDDGHTFGGSTCPGVQISSQNLSGCRDVTGTSRDHVPGLSEQGGVTIWVRAYDKTGNIGDWSAPVHYYYDATAPEQPVLISPANGAVVNGSSITQSWSDTSSDVAHYIYESYNDAAATSLRWHQVFSGSTTSKTATNVGTTTYWWRVKAVDSAGNESAWSPLWKITVDNTAPVVTVTPVAGSLLHGTETFNITINDANPANPANNHIWVYLYNSGGTQKSQGASVDLSSGHGTFTVDTTKLNDGDSWLDVGKLYDAAGNPSGIGDTYFAHYTIDNSAPTGLANHSPSNGTHTTTANQTTVTWKAASDASGPITYYYESSLSKTSNPDGSFKTPVYGPASTGTNTFINTSNTPAGTYYWHVKAVDALGNSSAWTTPWKITVDNIAPTAAFTFPTPGTSAKSFTVTFDEAVKESDAKNPANYFLNNWPGATSFASLAGHVTITYKSSTHTATVTFTDSGWYVSAEQQWGVQNIHDLAGNLLSPNPTTAYSTNLVNPMAPGAPTTTSPNNSHAVTWTWTAATDPGGANASGVKGYHYTLTSGATTVVGPTFTTSLGATTNVPADGSYTLHVYAVDNAGNSSSSVTGDVVVDTAGPALTIDPIGTSTETMPTITGTTSDPSGIHNVVVTVNGHDYTAVVTGSTWSATVTDPLSVGSYTASVTSRDTLGNGTTETANFAVTAVTPANTTTTPATPATITFTVTPNNNQAPAAPQVLGDSTTTPSTDSGNTGNVKGDSTVNTQNASSKTSNNFLGLGWWWLLVLAAVLSLFWFLVGGRADSNEKA